MGAYQEEESVYSLIPRPQEVPTRPPRHVSGFPGKTHPSDLEFGQTKLQARATFGLPDGANAPSTTKFLKSHEKAPVLPEPGPPTMTKTKLRPSVPKRDEKPTMGLTSNKNFITANAVEVILAKPGKQPQEEFQWTTRPGYGNVPMYLRRNKAIVQQERENFEQYVRMHHAPPESQSTMQLSNEDRRQLLGHLKKKWASINEAYQKFSLSVDTEQKKRRKEEMERQLAEVERDIKSLERGDMVLVVDD